ncbi:rhamnan synthesis F family protein [Candidatus Deianiraea vastatrix]|uniref:LPS synthesis glycosyltransferase n=1 Tax=Candidatus Deianiraea vastatrix TaxID=2163644 RepID=A0A5B8XG90_9RICK|nr:rhamnan synthesis F family protein [Candidatus Deianiraea vastatrix]QED23875.1 Putative LPS synthesis glycosyltransferase [Candidatus Deianiraea vastatrix]
MKNRICFFAHYDQDGIIDDYVVYYIKELKKVCNDIVFASVSNVSEKEQKKLDGIITTFINRENEGYDFGSWRDGMKHIGFENLSQYDEVVLANDSCYGPIYNIEDVFATMEIKKIGAWSITIGESISRYLQSYFLVLRKEVFEKEFFVDFFLKVENKGSKIDYIKDFELGFSKLLMANNIKIAAYCKVSFLDTFKQGTILKIKAWYLRKFIPKYIRWTKSFGDDHKNLTKRQRIMLTIRKLCNLNYSNPSLIMVSIMIRKYKLPIVKVMLFRDNPFYENIRRAEKMIKKYTKYDFSLIERHLHRVGK